MCKNGSMQNNPQDATSFACSYTDTTEHPLNSDKTEIPASKKREASKGIDLKRRKKQKLALGKENNELASSNN